MNCRHLHEQFQTSMGFASYRYFRTTGHQRGIASFRLTYLTIPQPKNDVKMFVIGERKTFCSGVAGDPSGHTDNARSLS